MLVVNLYNRFRKGSQFTEKHNILFQKRLERLPFYDHPAFLYSFSDEGYYNCKFGAVAGPAASVQYIAHELAHCVEFGSSSFRKRFRGGTLVFKRGQYLINKNTEFEDWLFNKPVAMLRECRTVGIEAHILEMMYKRINILVHFKEFAAALWSLPDWYLHPKDNKEIVKLMFESYEKHNKKQICNEIVTWLDKVKRTKAFKYANIEDNFGYEIRRIK